MHGTTSIKGPSRGTRFASAAALLATACAAPLLAAAPAAADPPSPNCGVWQDGDTVRIDNCTIWAKSYSYDPDGDIGSTLVYLCVPGKTYNHYVRSASGIVGGVAGVKDVYTWSGDYCPTDPRPPGT